MKENSASYASFVLRVREIRFSAGRSFAIANSVVDYRKRKQRETTPPPCLIPRPVPSPRRIHKDECCASQLYRVCGRASRFPPTTLAPNPFQPFGSLFSDSKPADLQAPSTPVHPRPRRDRTRRDEARKKRAMPFPLRLPPPRACR